MESTAGRCTCPPKILKAAIVGIDIGKNAFHVAGQDERGAIVQHQKWSRGQLAARFASMPPCLIGMEACVGAHHLSSRLKAKGHQNDFRDAEAVQRPTTKFVSTKTADRLDLQAMRRVRDRLVSQRTGIHQRDPRRPAGARRCATAGTTLLACRATVHPCVKLLRINQASGCFVCFREIDHGMPVADMGAKLSLGSGVAEVADGSKLRISAASEIRPLTPQQRTS